MDRANRNELLKTIEAQQEKINKYQTKFRDLIVSYKGLTKEKEALEASVKALNAAQVPSQTSTGHGQAADTEGEQDFQDPLNVQAATSDVSDARVQQLREQISTLTNSLSTVTEEKSKLQVSFQNDKKIMRQEHEEAINKLTAERDELEKAMKEVQNEAQEWRSRVRNAQYEREKDQNDHAMMLRELQKLLAEERITKEQLEHQIDDLKAAVTEKQNQPDISVSYEKRIQNLSNELEAVRRRLKLSEEKATQPSPLLLKLQEEMAEIKASHRIAIQQEQHRANEAEEKLRQIGQHGEERVSLLEAKLSELSEVVGNYERLRYQDQTAIQKLRERVTQLDLENTALAKAAHRPGDQENTAEETLDVQALIEKIIRLKGQLKLANESSEKPFNIEELLQVGDLVSLDGSEVHRKCHDEYEQLKEEFERYKLRAQSVLKNKSSKEGTPSKEMESLKGQVAEFKERLRDLRMEYDEAEVKNKEKIKDLHQTIKGLQTTHKLQMTNQEHEHKQKLADLEQEIRRHRDRTISLLAEKDKEIELLRARSPEKYESQYVSSFRRMSSQASEESCEGGRHTEAAPLEAQTLDESAVNELLYRSSLQTGAHADTSILHFAQEQARKDVEIHTLRKQKHTTEIAIRELQHTFSLKEQKYTDELEDLKENIRKLERNINRENANLEYLKNVVYHYMVCKDTAGKQQMLNAISTILQFSPQEKGEVAQVLKSGWWGYPSKNPHNKLPHTKL